MIHLICLYKSPKVMSKVLSACFIIHFQFYIVYLVFTEKNICKLSCLGLASFHFHLMVKSKVKHLDLDLANWTLRHLMCCLPHSVGGTVPFLPILTQSHYSDTGWPLLSLRRLALWYGGGNTSVLARNRTPVLGMAVRRANHYTIAPTTHIRILSKLIYSRAGFCSKF